MKKLAVALTLALALLAATLWLLRLAPSETSSPAIAVAPPVRNPALGSVAPERTGVEGADRLAQEPPVGIVPQAGERPTAIVIVVRRVEDESAVAGVEVSVRLEDEKPEGRTDDAGRCRFETEPGTWFSWARAAATPETTSVFWSQSRVLPAGEETELVLRVSRGATVAGRVVDESDRPVAGALVKGWCGNGYERALPPDRTATAGSEGSFALAHLGAAFRVVAEAPGFACLEGLVGELGPGDIVDDARVVLAPSAELRGRVLDQGDLPVEGALVVMRDGNFDAGKASAHSGVHAFQPLRSQARSGADGSFALGIFPGKPLPASATREGYHPWRGTLEPGKGDQIVRLDAGIEVTGRVLDHEGKPVEGASVRWRESQANTARATSDARGEFRLQGLGTTDSGALFVRAKGHAILVQQPISISDQTLNWIEVRLEAPLALAGIVVDGDGKPVPKAQVRIVGDRVVEYEDIRYAQKMTWEQVHNVNTAATGEDGRFRFDDLYDGEFTVTAASSAIKARAGNENLVLRLDEVAQVTLTGRVRDALSGEPIRDFTLVPMLPTTNGGLSGGHHRVSDDDGRFRIGSLPPGPMQLIVQANGYATWSDALREYAPGEHPMDLALHPARALSLRVVDRQGRPVQGEVAFRTLDGLEIWPEVAPGSRASRLTLEQGEATAKGLPGDRIQLVVRTADRGAEWPFDVDLRVEPPGVLEFTLPVDSIGVVYWSAVVCGARPGAHLENFDGPYREEWMAELRSPGDAWLIDRELDVRFVSASGEAVATVSLRPEGEHGYKARWARGSWSGEVEIETPILAIQIPVDTVRAELRAPGYEALDLPIDATQDRQPMRTVFLTRTP